jgi:hypothetical protein
MEIIAHQYLTKLRIIAKIPKNGQLDLTNNDLNIYNSTLINWFYRKLQGDGKLNTVAYLITFYREINGFTTELMKSIDVEQNSIVKSHKTILLTSMAEKIKESTIGVDNLMKTYRQYHKIISTLESIQQDIIENQLKNIVMFIPENFKTSILRDIENGPYDKIISSSYEKETTPPAPLDLQQILCESRSMPINIQQRPASPLMSQYGTPRTLSESFPSQYEAPLPSKEATASNSTDSNKKNY